MARINIRRIVGSLMVGVVATVLVAWGCHRSEKFPQRSYSSDVRSWPVVMPEEWPATYEASISFLGMCKHVTHYHHNLHQLAPPNVIDHRFDRHTLVETKSGWPCLAVRRFVALKVIVGVQSHAPLGLLQEGVPTPKAWRGLWTDADDRLPMLPLWPGFLANTLFYASVPWLLMFGVATLKRRRRAKRGLCVQCAYPIVGVGVCPECGTAVVAEAPPPAGLPTT